jgi:hypothetical protein
MAKLKFSVISLPKGLKVGNNCVLKLHLRKTENEECGRCGGFYIENSEEKDPFNLASDETIICKDCHQVESELMDY